MSHTASSFHSPKKARMMNKAGRKRKVAFTYLALLAAIIFSIVFTTRTLMQIDAGKEANSEGEEEHQLSDKKKIAEDLEEESLGLVRQPSLSLTTSSSSSCAPRKGLVVLSLLGRLGNNLYEVGFANYLATELCWDVVYRKAWHSEFLTARAQECFPNALLPFQHIPKMSSQELTQFQDLIGLNISSSSTQWLGPRGKQASQWAQKLKSKGLLLPCFNDGTCNFREDGVEQMLSTLRDASSTKLVLYLGAFFIHYDWIRKVGLKRMKDWFTPHPSCCHHTPPSDAVVIHIRNHEIQRYNAHLNLGVYMDILQKYNLLGRPVWIVCQPEMVRIQIIQELINATSAVVHTGDDQYDAFCILQHAHTLILSSGSTFSHMGALLAGPPPEDEHHNNGAVSSAVDVHHPLTTLTYPPVTISVPSWKYHLVSKSRDSVAEFDVSHDRLQVKMA